MSHDVFISYATEDKYIADAICSRLENNQVRCWIAPRDIQPGDNYAHSIIKAIDNSNVFVVIFSHNSNASPHVRTEIERAFNDEKIIIPFRIENIEPSTEMQYYFGARHWLDAMSPPIEAHINSLVGVIIKNLDQKIESKSDIRPQKLNNALANPISRIFAFFIDFIIGISIGFIIAVIILMVIQSVVGTEIYNQIWYKDLSKSTTTAFGDFIQFLLITTFSFIPLFIFDSRYGKGTIGRRYFKLNVHLLGEQPKYKSWMKLRSFAKYFPILVIGIGFMFNSFNPTIGLLLVLLGI